MCIRDSPRTFKISRCYYDGLMSATSPDNRVDITQEKPVYPLTFEIFPAQEGAQAAFTLYEDEGEDLGYQRDEFVKTPIICSTLANGYELTVSAREGKGYTCLLYTSSDVYQSDG